MKFRSACAVLAMTVALAACGELPFQKSAEPEAAPGHSGPPTVSPLEQPIETGGEAKPIATAEARTLNTAIFRAAGAGWAVTANDKTAVYERSGAKSVGVTVRRMVYGRGVEFIGTMNGSVFALNIQAAECEVGDQKSPFTARLRVGSQRLTGCAAPTDTMPKAQVRASSAAPKPKAQPKPAAPATKPAAPASDTTAPAAENATGTSKPETSTDNSPATTPATTTPATTTPATTAPETTAPATGSTSTAPASTTPESAAPTTAPAAPASEPAPAASGSPAPASGVPAPELVLPPATSE